MNDVVSSPFGSLQSASSNQSAGAMQLHTREDTEVMAMTAMAKRFPRDPRVACDKIKNAFTRVSLATVAQYQFARGGSDITGPSIRSAEAIAQQWGNMSNGWREVSRYAGPDGVGISEVESFSVDYESTNREAIRFFVRHWRDTKKGGYALKEERDIYELCANQAQRRKRACILANIPSDVVEMAMDQAAVTLKTTADTSPEAMTKMVEAFSSFGITKEHIEKRIQRRIDAIQPAQVVVLKRIYVSLRDEMSEPADWFEMEAAASPPAAATTVKDLKAKAKDKVAPPPPPPATEQGSGEPKPPKDETKVVAGEPGGAKAETTGGPIVTFAQVQHDLNQAKDLDELDAAATLIQSVGNRAQQKELNESYAQRRSALGGD